MSTARSSQVHQVSRCPFFEWSADGSLGPFGNAGLPHHAASGMVSDMSTFDTGDRDQDWTSSEYSSLAVGDQDS